MAIHSYQIAGKFSSNKELIPSNKGIKEIIRLGIQGREGLSLSLDHKTILIGKSGVLYYENAGIKSIKLNNSKNDFVIIDFTYKDFIEEE